ncbi:hypothetical protein Cgig2_019384 [Carnegiea gigantea]|uniref:Gag-pol polyprotein n=1 Tax=Carnegiea gigantea TaxID=171969 RepID=A0A9Q1KCG3_9CARY|nr:hypothetical protein Cgig2_019384 [Carnegiea gigantea]
MRASKVVGYAVFRVLQMEKTGKRSERERSREGGRKVQEECIQNNVCLTKRQRIMQFLMHLNEEYEAIRGQIFLLDPLPIVNKAYSMIQRVEKQRRVTNFVGISREVAAFVNRTSISNNGEVEAANAFLPKNRIKKDLRKTKSNKFCDYCQRTGHERDQCFKIIGYPEWYDRPKGKKKIVGPRQAANFINHSGDQDTPLDEDEYSIGGTNKSQFDSSFIQALAQEVMKITKGNQSNGNQHDTMVGTYENFAGGNVQLADKIILRTVLYVPEFKFNLLSLIKLLLDQNLCIHLYSTECIFQDLTTSQVVAVAHEHNGLHKLEPQANSKHIKKGGLGRRNSKQPLTDSGDQNMKAAVPSPVAIANKACSMGSDMLKEGDEERPCRVDLLASYAERRRGRRTVVGHVHCACIVNEM